MAKKPQDISLKLLVLGASGTGKTRFIERYCRGSYNSTAVGDVTIKIVKIKGIRFTVSQQISMHNVLANDFLIIISG
jgi:GTPase SAR1 family protein